MNKSLYSLHKMGNKDSLPALDFVINSNCCNVIDESDGEMVQPEKSSRIHKCKKIGKKHKHKNKRDKEMAEQSTSVQLEQANEETIPD